jgi:hypothetical protein
VNIPGAAIDPRPYAIKVRFGAAKLRTAPYSCVGFFVRAAPWKIPRCRSRQVEADERVGIQRIGGGQEQFYTVDKSTGRKVYIGVVRNDGGKAPYLRTHADGKWNDNLLAQLECGADCKVVS